MKPFTKSSNSSRIHQNNNQTFHPTISTSNLPSNLHFSSQLSVSPSNFKLFPNKLSSKACLFHVKALSKLVIVIAHQNIFCDGIIQRSDHKKFLDECVHPMKKQIVRRGRRTIVYLDVKKVH
jgi:hypothetical protein